MPFLNNIPQPGDKLKNSQGQLLGNNQQLNVSFGIDHYPYTDLTANNGKHKQVTTPIQMADPASTITDPKFYGRQITVPVGALQYSRGWDDINSVPAVPTPVTSLQSQSTPLTIGSSSTVNVMDFTGLQMAFAVLYTGDTATTPSLYSSVTYIFWTGTAFVIKSMASASFITVTSNTNILQILNTGPAITNFYSTLQFIRLQ